MTRRFEVQSQGADPLVNFAESVSFLAVVCRLLCSVVSCSHELAEGLEMADDLASRPCGSCSSLPDD